jgi:hypothetical protein
MDKNKYSVEEPDNTDNSSMEGSDGELFVTRVSSSGVVLKFKARKNGTFPSASNGLTHELTFSEKGNACGPLKYIEANCNQSNLWLWNDLVRRIMHVRLNDQKDVFIWNLHQNGIYTVYSLYLTLINNGMANINKQLWRVKTPLKIKIFMWYMKKEVVLTKDNLARRNWGGSKQCSFCLHNETIQYLFFYCYYARFISGLTHTTFGITPLHNIQHMFGPWTNQVGDKLK